MPSIRLGHQKPDGNTAVNEREPLIPASRGALLTVREALILAGGLVTGVTAGVLTYFAVHNPALAVLAVGPACAGAVKFLDAVIA